jgi:hypothetical protein
MSKVTQEQEISKGSQEEEMPCTQRSRQETDGGNGGTSNREHVEGELADNNVCIFSLLFSFGYISSLVLPVFKV